MNPIVTLIVTALASGAAAAAKPTAEKAVKEAYEGLKTLIKRKFQQVSVEDLEKNPASENKRGSLREDLEKAGADKDTEVFQLAQALRKIIQEKDPTLATSIGLVFETLEVGQDLKIENIEGFNIGVKAKQIKTEGNAEFYGVRRDSKDGNQNPN